MSYQVLARKWRPQRFNDFVGQESTVRALTHMLTTSRLHHAVLFSGTRGVGKTTLARLFAKAMNCERGISDTPCEVCRSCVSFVEGNAIDFIEIDAASRTKVEDTRELLENITYPPHHSRFKIYLVDEVHMLSTHSFNAFLKTLEEPPSHIKILFATTDPQKIPMTVRSRCLHFTLRKIPTLQIVKRLEWILNEEGILFQDNALNVIAQKADGSLRDALTLLDQVISDGSGTVVYDTVAGILGLVSETEIIALLDAILKNDMAMVQRLFQEFSALDVAYDSILASLCEYLHDIHKVQMFGQQLMDGHSPWQEYSRVLSTSEVQKLYQMLITGRRDLGAAPSLQLGFEMLILRLIAFLIETRKGKASTLASPSTVQSENHAKQENPVGQMKPQSNPNEFKEGYQQKSTAPLQSHQPVPEKPSTVHASHPKTEAPATTSAPMIVSSENWPTIVAQLKLSGLHRMLIEQSVLLQMTGSEMVLQLPAASRLMLNKSVEEAISQSIAAYLKHRIQVRFEMKGEGVPATAPVHVFAAERDAQLQTQKQAVLEHPFVQEAMTHFGEGLHITLDPIDHKK